MKKKNTILLCTLLVFCGAVLTCCGNTQNKDEKEPEIQQEMKEEEPQVQQTPQTEPEEEEVIFSEEYVDLKGYLTAYSDEYQEYYYHTVDVIGKFASNNNYLVRATDGNELEVSEEDIVLLNGTTGIVNVDSTVYAEPNIEAEEVNVGYGLWREEGIEDFVLEAGNIVSIDMGYENEEFYFITLSVGHCFWEGYILKEKVDFIEPDGVIYGTILENENVTDTTASKEWKITGDVEAGENVVVLGNFKSGYYANNPIITEDYHFDDGYLVLTEDGEVGYVRDKNISILSQ